MKYLVLLDDLADEVPMPYRLFSHTKTQGRDQTVSISISTSDLGGRRWNSRLAML